MTKFCLTFTTIGNQTAYIFKTYISDGAFALSPQEITGTSEFVETMCLGNSL